MSVYTLPEDPVDAFRVIYRLQDTTQRIILLNHHFNGMTYQEIADDLKLSIKSVFSQKREALQLLSEGLPLSEGEQELADYLSEYGYSLRRGGPSDGTVPDLIGLPGIHIECRRTEKIDINAAMMQSVHDAERFRDGMPVVFHRQNRSPWLVTVWLDGFMKLYRRETESELSSFLCR